MNVNFSVTFAGAPDIEDQRTAYQAVFIENQLRAALIPPGTPLSTATLGDLKASYLLLLTIAITELHNKNILLAKTQAISTRFTDAQLKEMFGNFMDALNAGQSVATVIAKTI